MILRMLIENESNTAKFDKEHGISLLIEFQGRKLLFDTGASGTFVDNAIKMGIDIRDVDTVILSHAHSDHSGGLPRFLGINSHAPVYVSEKSRLEYYAGFLFKKENISIPKKVFLDFQDRLSYINDFTEISEDVFIVSGFERKYPLPKSNRELLVKRDGSFHQDDFKHEIALVLKNEGKLVIITGCSHNGVLNMVESITGLFPGIPIKAVVGGFHLIGFPFHKLMGEKRASIEAIGKRLLEFGVEKTYTCHCSGNWGFSVLKEMMGDRVTYFYTGMQVEL